jgi:CheY-like chemotaxis protein
MYSTTRQEGTTPEAPLPAFVVEDDAGMLRLLTELAASAGLEPRAFTRLSDVRRALRERLPAVVLVDDDLPDGHGADLVRELREDPRTRHVRAIVCTGADPARRRQISRIAPVISKPFSARQVEDALRQVATRQAV